MRFESPLALLFLIALPALWYWRLYVQPSGALVFSTTRHAVLAGQSWRQRFRHTPLALRSAALALLIVGLARPQYGTERVVDASQGIAIGMVVDRSGSMSAEILFDGKRMNQLDVVKRVFKEFLFGNGRDLSGRPNDLIGLVSFARYADTVCPLTLGHDALAKFVDDLKLVPEELRRSEDGTNIAGGIALAAARLKTAEETLAQQRKINPDTYHIKSKVIILLTDGVHNTAGQTPLEAAALAKEWGIKIYTIGIGEDNQGVVQTPLGFMRMPSGPSLDEAGLTAIAKATGGFYRRAKDGNALRAIYEEIDRMEKSEIQTFRYLDYKEWFAPLVLGGLGLLIVEVLLGGTVFRRLP